VSDAIVWHDVECGSYDADLPLWEELAEAVGEPILELGCGTGRVALHLARRGHGVHGLDTDASLLEALEERAAAAGLDVPTERADIRTAPLPDESYRLVIAPMQLIQLLDGPAGRSAALGNVAGALRPGGLAALALVEGSEDATGEVGPGTVPDVRERDGWLHSSLPLDVVARDGSLEVRRLRQSVAPDGGMSEHEHTDRLDVIDVAALESEARRAGLEPAGRRDVSASDLHVASTIVLLRKGH
jgi:SAM-dependent methyltransferase